MKKEEEGESKTRDLLQRALTYTSVDGSVASSSVLLAPHGAVVLAARVRARQEHPVPLLAHRPLPVVPVGDEQQQEEDDDRDQGGDHYGGNKPTGNNLNFKFLF